MNLQSHFSITFVHCDLKNRIAFIYHCLEGPIEHIYGHCNFLQRHKALLSIEEMCERQEALQFSNRQKRWALDLFLESFHSGPQTYPQLKTFLFHKANASNFYLESSHLYQEYEATNPNVHFPQQHIPGRCSLLIMLEFEEATLTVVLCTNNRYN